MKAIGELLGKYQNIVLKGFDPVSAGGFTQVPNILIRTTKLSSTTKLIYAQLLSYAWNNNLCFPGQETLAEDSCTSLATITRSIRELVKQGWLEVRRRGQGKTNVYVLKYVVEKSKQVNHDSSKMTNQNSSKMTTLDVHQ